MATQAQIVANRRNARKSTGPRSSEGKAAVSQNAVKHGKSPGRRTTCPSCQLPNQEVSIMQNHGRIYLFDNCRESSTNRPFLCKAKPI